MSRAVVDLDPEAVAHFDEVSAALLPLGARRAAMMGRPMLAAGSRMVACLDSDVLGVRLGAGTPEFAAALAMPAAALFSPGERGRIFRDWVGLPVTAADRWQEFAQVALDRWLPGR